MKVDRQERVYVCEGTGVLKLASPWRNVLGGNWEIRAVRESHVLAAPRLKC